MNQNLLSSASDQYRIEREYARGGMGVTYLAIREKSGERCILKQLRLEKVSDWKVVELFEREAEILRQLNHPNIPSYIDYFISESNLHFNLVQTFIEGRTMQEWIDKRLPASTDQFVLYFIQALEILEYLHALVPAVIHRDITPKNMILQDDKLFLVDFGSVKNAVNPHSASGSTVIGTYGYMPPEQYLGHTEPGSDLYSLGMSFVSFAGHKDPFELVNPELGRVEIKNELDALPVHVRSLLLDMIEPSLPKRLKSATAAKQRLLHPELAAVPATGQALTPQDQVDVNKSKAALYILLFLFLIAGIIALIYTVQTRQGTSSVAMQAAPTADLEIRESSAIRGYAVSHHQKWIAVALSDRLMIRDATNGDPLKIIMFDTLKPPSLRPDLFTNCRMFFTTDDLQLVIISDFMNKVYWWNTSSWRPSTVVHLPEGSVLDVKPSSDQTFIITMYNNKKSQLSVLRCTDKKYKLLHQIKLAGIELCAVDSIPEKIVFVMNNDSTMNVYDLLKKEIINTHSSRGAVQSIKMDYSGKRLAWHTEKQWCVAEIQNNTIILSGEYESDKNKLIRGTEIQITPNGHLFAHYEKSFFRSKVTLYSLEQRKAVQTVYPDDSGMMLVFTASGGLQFTPAQNRIALLNYDKISFWNIEHETVK